MLAALIALLPLDGLPGGPLARGVVALQGMIHVADLGFPGLALATSVAALANASYLLAVARRRYGRLFVGDDWRGFAGVGLASAGMAVAVLAALAFVPLPEDKLLGAVHLAGMVAVGVAVYGLLLAALRSSELRTLIGIFRRRQ